MKPAVTSGPALATQQIGDKVCKTYSKHGI